MSKGKRGNNEGSIRQRADGTWESRVSLPDGKRKSIYGRTRAEVAGKLTKAMGDRDKGLPLPSEKETIAGYLGRWLTDVCKDSVRPNTYAAYERTLRLHVIPRIGRVKLARLGAPDLAKLYRELRDSGLSPRSVQLAHAVLHKALEQALRWDLIVRNVADLVDSPRVERQEQPVLTPEQCQVLIDGSRGEPLHALFVLALTGGLRVSECLGLQWDAVNWEQSSVRVVRQLTRIKGEGFKLTEPKSARGRRTVTLPPVAMQALKRHRTAQVEERLQAPAWEDWGLVFCTQIGTPLERQNVHRRHWKPLLRQLGLPDAKFHGLRHGMASLLLKAGEHPKVVQERLGHASIGMTMDVYSHLLPGMQESAAAKLAALFPAADA